MLALIQQTLVSAREIVGTATLWVIPGGTSRGRRAPVLGREREAHRRAAAAA